MFVEVTLSLLKGFLSTVELFALTLLFALPLGLLIGLGEKSKIKASVHSYCTHLKKMGKIRGFVAGECWSSEDEVCKNILRFAPDVEIKENLLAHNSGISIILI